MGSGAVDTTVLLWVLLAVLVVRVAAAATLRLSTRRLVATSPASLLRVEAERRAEALLRDILPAEDYQQLCLRGYLEVCSQRFPGRTYRISRYPEGVTIYEDARYVGSLCAVPAEELPSGDVILLHKLMLSADEDEYLKVAHRFR